MDRWHAPWRDEYGDVRPGWALAGFAAFIVAIALGVQVLNDMHMYGYGLFGR